MRVIHDQKWTPAEVENFRQQVFNNLTFGLKAVYDAMEYFELEVTEENKVNHPHGRRDVQLTIDRNISPTSIHPLIFVMASRILTSILNR